MTFELDHLHLRSLDPQAAAEFYAGMFDGTVTGRMEHGAALRVTVQLAGVRLFIDRVPPGTHRPLPPPALGLEHLGLVVADLDAAVAELTARGAVFTQRPTSPRPGTRIAFVQAPDGAQVEILERTAVPPHDGR